MNLPKFEHGTATIGAYSTNHVIGIYVLCIYIYLHMTTFLAATVYVHVYNRLHPMAPFSCLVFTRISCTIGLYTLMIEFKLNNKQILAESGNITFTCAC